MLSVAGRPLPAGRSAGVGVRAPAPRRCPHRRRPFCAKVPITTREYAASQTSPAGDCLRLVHGCAFHRAACLSSSGRPLAGLAGRARPGVSCLSSGNGHHHKEVHHRAEGGCCSSSKEGHGNHSRTVDKCCAHKHSEAGSTPNGGTSEPLCSHDDSRGSGVAPNSEHSHSHLESSDHSHSHSHSHVQSESKAANGSGSSTGGSHSHEPEAVSSCGCHDHSHGPGERNAIVQKIFTFTGLQVIYDILQGSKLSYPTAAALFAVALVLPFLSASQHVQSVAAGLTGGVYFLAGLPSFMDVCHDIASLNINTHVLTLVAVACLIPLGNAIEGALLLLLFKFSHVLEDSLTVTAQGDLRALFDSIPDTAFVVQMGEDGEPSLSSQVEVAACQVEVGQLVVVRAGQEVPLDGDIFRGEAMLSMKHISGEALPQHRKRGSPVPAGGINNDGLLVVKVTATSDKSTPARMAELARKAQNNKPKVQTFLARIGAQYSKFVLGATVAIAVLLPLCFGIPFTAGEVATSPGSLYRAAGFLTTAAPCAILMAPLVYVSAIAAATQRGILLKGSSVLDALARCRIVALDKTGTLTTGEMTCTAIVPLVASAETGRDVASDALAVALEISRGSMHPVSKAVVDAIGSSAATESLPPVHLQSFSSMAGGGISGDCVMAGDGGVQSKVLFGSEEYIASQLRDFGFLQEAETLESSEGAMAGVIVSFLVQIQKGRVVGVHAFHFTDRPHPSSPPAIAALRELRPASNGAVQIFMLSGDNVASANAMGNQLGLRASEILGGLKPEEKLSKVSQLRGSGSSGILMVGDGINDAPALAAADVGLAIAPTPATAAASAADGLILSSTGAGVSSLPFLLSLSSFTQTVLKQNLVLALLAIAGTALPAVLGIMPLWVGVSIHEGSTVLVAVNSLRPLLHKGPSVDALSSALAGSSATSGPGTAQGRSCLLDALQQEKQKALTRAMT